MGSYLAILIGKLVKNDKVFNCNDLVILVIPIFLFGLIKLGVYMYIQNTGNDMRDFTSCIFASIYSIYLGSFMSFYDWSRPLMPRSFNLISNVVNNYLHSWEKLAMSSQRPSEGPNLNPTPPTNPGPPVAPDYSRFRPLLDRNFPGSRPDRFVVPRTYSGLSVVDRTYLESMDPE